MGGGLDIDQASPALDFTILGPLRVVRRGAEVSIASRRQRALLLLLLLDAGRVVPAERLIDQLWNGHPPPQAAITLRSYVSNLRQTLGGPRDAGSLLVTRAQGYCLDVPRETIDAERLRLLTASGRRQLREGRPTEALVSFHDAVSSWVGDPLAEISDHEVARAVITELTELFLEASEGRFAALMSVGRHLDAIPGLEAFVEQHPLREEPHALLMRSLYRAGRTPEALMTYHRFRNRLADELGIDPSPLLSQLHQQILQQDPALTPVRQEPSPAPQPTIDRPIPVPSRPATPSDPVLAPRIVGRDRELALLQKRLGSMLATGRGALVVVAGEPGIGKSTLLDEFDHFAVRTGVAVHRGRPPAAAGAPAFWPWSQILDSMASSLDDQALTAATAGAAKPVAQLSAAVAERSGGAWAPTGDRAETRRFLLYEAVSAFIQRATNGAPVVITLDDLHLADPATLELLSYITSSISDRPIMVLATYRTLPSDRQEHLEATLATIFREDVAEEIALSGLTRDDIADIVQDLSVGDGHRQEQQRFVDLLHERTGGNPFFVRQLARLMADNTTMMSDGSSTPVPAAVRHVILHRLRRLPENAAQFVDSAAVAGRDFDIRVVAAAAGLDADLAMDACDEAERHALVESTQSGDTSRRFVHALVQEVAVDQLPAGRAARLHAAVAAALAATGTGNHVEMATHMWLARGIVGRDAIPSQLAAAEEAIGVFAYDQAEHHLRRALTLVSENPPVDPTTELTLLLSLFRLIATDRGWGDEDLAGMVLRARELTYSAELTDPVIRLWWSVFLFLLETDDVVSYVEIAATLEKSIREAEPDGSESGSPGDVSTGAVHLMKFFSFLALGTKEQALHELRLARRHIEDAPAQASMAFDENLHVMLYLFEAYWAALTGDAEGHRNAADMARALADADGRPFARAVARTLGAASGTFAGSPGTVAEMAAEALEMDHRFGFSWLATVARSVHHWADALGEGNSDEASEALGTTLESLMSSGRSGSRSSFLLWMADISAATGDRDRARALLLESREHPGPYQQLFVEMVDARLARLT